MSEQNSSITVTICRLRHRPHQAAWAAWQRDASNVQRKDMCDMIRASGEVPPCTSTARAFKKAVQKTCTIIAVFFQVAIPGSQLPTAVKSQNKALLTAG